MVDSPPPVSKPPAPVYRCWCRDDVNGPEDDWECITEGTEFDSVLYSTLDIYERMLETEVQFLSCTHQNAQGYFRLILWNKTLVTVRFYITVEERYPLKTLTLKERNQSRWKCKKHHPAKKHKRKVPTHAVSSL